MGQKQHCWYFEWQTGLRIHGRHKMVRNKKYQEKRESLQITLQNGNEREISKEKRISSNNITKW